MTPGLLGISHVAVSVPDVDAAVRFWCDVLGFRLVEQQPAFAMMVDDASRTAVIVTDHDGEVLGPFDETNAGLDHLALAVPDVESLTAWQQRLEHAGAAYTPIVESDAGHHLNLRVPGNIALELTVINDEFAAALGLREPAEAVAGTHV